MKVVVAYKTLDPAVRTALEMDNIDAIYVHTDADDAYYNLWQRLWQEQETFVLIEGDDLPWPGAVEQVWGCSEAWCGFLHYIHGYLQAHLGACVKFSDRFIRQRPQLISRIAEIDYGYFPKTTWRGIDVRILHVLRTEYGVPGLHLHGPAITHLNLAHRRKAV